MDILDGIFLIIVISIAGILTVSFIINTDCNARASYWNDRGLFIDRFDFNIEYMFTCDYPEIPKENNIKTISDNSTSLIIDKLQECLKENEQCDIGVWDK